MKVITISRNDILGGAARAAYRIHHALRSAGLDSMMMVDSAVSGDWTVQAPVSRVGKEIGKLKRLLESGARQLLKTENRNQHSPGITPSQWPGLMNSADVDILHLHWINSEMMSIGDIGKITKPVVWTLHDMWAFCGAEHYTEDFRWKEGYRNGNRSSYERGFDLNRWTWKRKKKHWKRPFHIVTPSRWLAQCVESSELMKNWPVYSIPNAIDCDLWSPTEQARARELLQLPQDISLLLFGAMGGTSDPRKGYHLLLESLAHLKSTLEGLELLVFGALPPQNLPDLGFPVRYLGHLHDDLSLRLAYCAADALIIPSRQDNLPNTGVEAHACGTPIIAFDIGGLPDIVMHQKTGYLARPFDTVDLACGIEWTLKNRGAAQLSENAREKAVQTFSYPVVAEQYMKLYLKVLNGKGL